MEKKDFEKEFSKIKKVVLEKIKPKKFEVEKTKKTVEEFKNKLDLDEDIEFFLGGSYAKNTWLSKSKDIDVFLRFDKKKYFGKDISKIAFNILNKNFDVKILHGSRDYFNVKFKNLNFEIIPVFKIENFEDKENIMDLSPLHVLYVNNNLNNNDDVRILKYFLKQNNLYGAESYIEGFSGYVCELLIIYYNSIEELFYNVLEWGEEVFIDIEGYYKSVFEAKSFLKEKWNVLTIVDPVQKDRNASKSLSKKNFEAFKILVKDFYNNVSLKFFNKKKVFFKKPYFEVKLYGLNDKKDVSASMLKKVVEFLIKNLKVFDFKSLYFYDEKNNVLVLKFKVKNVVVDNIVEGPKIVFEKAVLEFYKKHNKKNCFVRNGRVYCVEGKLYFEKVLKKLLKDNIVKKRVKKVELNFVC